MAWARSGCRGDKNSSRRATDRRGSTVVAGGVISTRGGSTDRSSTYSGSTDANRHPRANTTVVAPTVNATAIDTAAIDTPARYAEASVEIVPISPIPMIAEAASERSQDWHPSFAGPAERHRCS